MFGCLHSWMCNKFFRYVAMNRHIKSVCFTTKIRKTRNIRPCFSNSGDNIAVSKLCNFSYKTTLLSPKTVLLLNIYLSMHTQLGGIYRVTILLCMHPQLGVGWHLSCYHLPSQPRLLSYFPLVPVNFLHVSLITHICGICARITVT